MSEINIVTLSTVIGGSLTIGFITGATAKYLFRVIAFITGIFIAFITYLDFIDFVTIEWDSINEDINIVVETLALLRVPDGRSVAEVADIFGIIGGFIVGFLIGYRFG